MANPMNGFCSTKCVDQWFDAMTGSFKAAMEAGKTMNECAGKAMGTWFNSGEAAPGPFNMTEQFSREAAPMVRKNMDLTTEAFEHTFKAGRDFFRAAFEGFNGTEENLHDRTRRVWDAAFTMMRTGTDAAVKNGTRMVENFNEFFHNTSCCSAAANGAPRTAAKTGK